MRRIFSTSEAQQTYDALMQVQPLRTAAIIGNAFFFGYDNPCNEGLPDLCGKPGSLARAAWAAGVDSRRKEIKVIGERSVLSRGLLARHG